MTPPARWVDVTDIIATKAEVADRAQVPSVEQLAELLKWVQTQIRKVDTTDGMMACISLSSIADVIGHELTGTINAA